MATEHKNPSLEEQDPEVYELIQQEKLRQARGIELIASENFTSRAVMQALGSCLTNKYSEGYPGKRYYGGNQYIDQIENLAISRALAAFGLDSSKWGVNVQPYSGSPANFEVYTALLQPHDRIMGLDLPHGGHLTHGFFTPTKKVSATSVYFESMPYRLDTETGLVDFEQLRATAKLFRPKIIIMGGSSYPRDWNYEEFRSIATEVGALLMCDMAHYAGLVASKVVQSPFDYADIVTTTVHKTLRGPRSGMIFYRKDERDFEGKIAQAVFPGCQGGPHNHQIAAIAVQMKEVSTPEFHAYARQVVANTRALAKTLVDRGYTLVSGGSDTHLVLWDLKNTGVSGGKFQILCDELEITINKNAVPGDLSALNPGGCRIGTSAMTTRGATEQHFETIAAFLHEAVELAKRVNQTAIDANNGETKVTLSQFTKHLDAVRPELDSLKTRVHEFTAQLFMPGQ